VVRVAEELVVQPALNELAGIIRWRDVANPVLRNDHRHLLRKSEAAWRRRFACGSRVIAMLASFAYQKFFSAAGQSKESQPATPP